MQIMRCNAGTVQGTVHCTHQNLTSQEHPLDQSQQALEQTTRDQSQEGSLLLVLHIYTLGKTGSAKTTIPKGVTCCWATCRSILTPGIKSDISANDPPAIKPAITWMDCEQGCSSQMGQDAITPCKMSQQQNHSSWVGIINRTSVLAVWPKSGRKTTCPS